MERRVIKKGEPGFCEGLPMPVAIVTCRDEDGTPEACPVQYWGRINGIPPLYYVSLCQRDKDHVAPLEEVEKNMTILPPVDPTKKDRFIRRYTAKILDKHPHVVLNLPSLDQKDTWLEAAAHSLFFQPKFDKFKACGWTEVSATQINAPMIGEAPVSIECRVFKQISLPTHDMYLLEPLVEHTAFGVETVCFFVYYFDFIVLNISFLA